MQLKISWQYCLAFMAFVFMFGQLHETVHMINAYSVCGVPGRQADFNLWTLADSCTFNKLAWLPTLFGPVFSYLMMWTGFILLLIPNKNLWAAGFVLVMGNLPFARIFTVAMGSGDEMVVLKTLLMAGTDLIMVKVIGFFAVFAFSFPPLYMCYKRLINKKRGYIIAGFCVIPLIIMWLYEFKLLGWVLHSGFLAKAHYLGTADFIYVHTLLMAMTVITCHRVLFSGRPFMRTALLTS